jgi:hypothetical protein
MHMHHPMHEDKQRGKTNPTVQRMQTNKVGNTSPTNRTNIADLKRTDKPNFLKPSISNLHSLPLVADSNPSKLTS